MTIDLDAPEDEWRAFITEEMLQQIELLLAIAERAEMKKQSIPLDS